MGSIISETSSYSMVVIMAAFLLIDIYVFFLKKPEKYRAIYFIQTLLVVSFHAVGYITLYVRDGDIRYFFFFAFQEIILFAIALIYRTVYRHMSHLLLNNMLMLVFVGFVILGRLAFDNAVRQFIITIVAFAISMCVPWFILKISKLKKMTYVYAGAGIFLLGAVWLTGAVTNGSRLAFRVLGMSFQPAEFVKISLVFFNAAILSDRKNKYRYLISALFTVIHVILLVLSRDLGSACIYCGTYLLMLFLSNRNVLTLLFGAVGGCGAAVLAYKMFSHVRVRVQTWLDPWGDMDNKSYQLSQSLFAIGTGEYFGMGLLQGNPYSIPYVNEDFVFSAIAEELGVVFSILLIILYLFIILHVLRMSFRVKDEFHSLVLAGCAVTLGIQVFLTIGGGTRLVPLTGVTLPLISMGGSSLTATILMFSVLHGIYIKEFTDYEKDENAEENTVSDDTIELIDLDVIEEKPVKTHPKKQGPAVRLFPVEDIGCVTQDTTVIRRMPEVKSTSADSFEWKLAEENVVSESVPQESEATEIKVESVPQDELLKMERKETFQREDKIKKETDWEHEDFQGDYRKDW